jgi:hypothetical protein
MDIAVNLVEAYLNANGYLTLTEFEVQRRLPDGTYETATDVDIVGVRLPGQIYEGDPHDVVDCELLLVEDPVLELEDGMVEVLVDLESSGLSVTSGLAGATIRSRLVAFGRSPRSDLHTVSLTHIIETMVEHLRRFQDILRPASYKDPAPAFLNLLVKIGFEIDKAG